MKNNKILVVLPTFNGDFGLAENLIKWIGELDSHQDFPILIVVDQEVAQERYTALFAQARAIFKHARLITVQVGNTGHKPNKMFMVAADYAMNNYGMPFLWLEPDCVPISSGWLEAINEEYQNQPLRYMGAIITQQGQPNVPPRHLTGCSVYPADAYKDFDHAPVNNGQEAWDIFGAERIATAAQNTNLIHHFWGQPDKAPEFVEQRTPTSPENEVTLDFVRTDAKLFHRCKNGSLIPLLRDKRKQELEKISFKPTGEHYSDGLAGKWSFETVEIKPEIVPPVTLESTPVVPSIPPLKKKPGRPPLAKPSDKVEAVA